MTQSNKECTKEQTKVTTSNVVSGIQFFILSWCYDGTCTTLNERNINTIMFPQRNIL